MRNQYEPLVTPAGWSGDEKRFAMRLTQILDELYNRVGTLRTSSNSLGKEKLDASRIANTLDVEEEGYVLDARQGKELAGRIDRAASMLYPVGSIYLSVAETDPAEIFGGVWERLEWVGDTGYGQESDLVTGAAGSGEAHNNMPPYPAVYAWKRVE